MTNTDTNAGDEGGRATTTKGRDRGVHPRDYDLAGTGSWHSNAMGRNGSAITQSNELLEHESLPAPSVVCLIELYVTNLLSSPR